ncbi:MAG: zinc-ribbon domain-containing protein [Clostridia bacterium]|nr:zinc-ribbon domain-containing protein [Clostridia bacterium]
MFCRFCGKQILDDSIFCSYCGKGTDRSMLKKARALTITGKYRQALEIYDELIDDDPSDINGYIGHLRVVSYNYTRFDGSYDYKNTTTNAQVYLDVSSAINTVEKLLGGNGSNDSEYDDFIKRYKKHTAEQERIRLEREKQRQYQLEQRKAENKKRHKEALETALKAGDEALSASNRKDAFKQYSRAIVLAKYSETTLPETFLNKLGEVCKADASEARYNSDVMEYFTELARANNPAAQFYLGYIYMWGKSSTVYDYLYRNDSGNISTRTSYPEKDKAESWFDKVLSNGSPEAMLYREETQKLLEILPYI